MYWVCFTYVQRKTICANSPHHLRHLIVSSFHPCTCHKSFRQQKFSMKRWTMACLFLLQFARTWCKHDKNFRFCFVIFFESKSLIFPLHTDAISCQREKQMMSARKICTFLGIEKVWRMKRICNISLLHKMPTVIWYRDQYIIIIWGRPTLKI